MDALAPIGVQTSLVDGRRTIGERADIDVKLLFRRDARVGAEREYRNALVIGNRQHEIAETLLTLIRVQRAVVQDGASLLHVCSHETLRRFRRLRGRGEPEVAEQHCKPCYGDETRGSVPPCLPRRTMEGVHGISPCLIGRETIVWPCTGAVTIPTAGWR